jgi:hypothetical protein
VKAIKKVILFLSFAMFVAGPVVTLAAPVSTFAADSDSSCEKPILGIHPWFRGLAVKDGTGADAKCVIVAPGDTLNGKQLDLSGFIWRIALNIVDMALAAIGYIAFFFILYGGFQFLTGGSNPSQIEKARKTMLNAIVGLVISLGAVAVVNLIFGIIG